MPLVGIKDLKINIIHLFPSETHSLLEEIDMYGKW